MQEPPKKKQTGRFALFLKSPRGQVLSTCSAVGALLCVIIGFLPSDYTRLAWPFGLASFFLALLGMASSSRRSFAQVVLILWVVQGQSLLQTTFDLGTQASLQAQLQQ